MKKHTGLQFLSLLLIGILIHSCQKDDDFLEPNNSIENLEIENDLAFGENIILGKQLENPFSV